MSNNERLIMNASLKEGIKTMPQDFRAIRKGDWIFVYADGHLIWRLFSRNREIGVAEIIFAENRSPNYPKTWEYLRRVGFLKAQRRGYSFRELNREYVFIEEE